MDLGSFSRSGGWTIDESWAAPPDYPMLVATLAAIQASSAAARAAAGRAARRPRPVSAEPLVDILLASAGWRDSVSVQGGCFHRRQPDRADGAS